MAEIVSVNRVMTQETILCYNPHCQERIITSGVTEPGKRTLQIRLSGPALWLDSEGDKGLCTTAIRGRCRSCQTLHTVFLPPEKGEEE